jgi:hypothetical protein
MDQRLYFTVVVMFLMMLIFIVAIIYLIDFFTGSALKRLPGFSKFYYPVYRFFSWMTLSRLYRPLYYNFIDNRVGFKAILAIVPYSLVLILVSNWNNSSFVSNAPGRENFAYGSVNNYLDTYHGESEVVPMINSKLIRDNYLELYLPLTDNYYRIIERICNEEAEAYSILRVVTPESKERYQKYEAFTGCVTNAFACYIDSLQVSLSGGILIENPQNAQPQLMVVVPLDSLSPGSHLLRIMPNWEAKRLIDYFHAIPFILQ